MGKIKETAYKLLTLFYAILSMFFTKRYKDNSRNILLIYSGGLGDGVLDAQAIMKIVYKLNAEGKKVSVLAVKPVCELYGMLFTSQDVVLIPCTFLMGNWATPEKREEFRGIVLRLRQERWERMIVRLNRVDLIATLLAIFVPAAQKTAFLYSRRPIKKRKQIIYCLICRAFDQENEFNEVLTQMQLSREFAKCMGVPIYPIRIMHIPKQSEAAVQDHSYITISIDSSFPGRRWFCENFIELICRLLGQYEYDVVLTGNNVAADILKRYDTVFGTNSRVKNMIGKTNLYEWIELIRGAQFHIGVDSGSIHVAASVGTQTFCLTGMWDSYRFFPYRIEEDMPETAVPICIYRNDVDPASLPCKNCNEYGGYGYGNKRCWEECQHGKPNLCLQNISVDGVMEVIKENHAD